jgi:phage terminase small subunit
MAGRGRKKLKALDILDGNPSHREIPVHGIETYGAPFIPEHLHEDARACIEVIKSSMPSKVYGTLDSYLLAAFGVAWAMHKAAATALSAPGAAYVVKGGVNRWVTVLEKATDKLATLSARLGLDPLSRQNLKVPTSRPEQSKFSGLLGGRIRSSNTSGVSAFQAERDKVVRLSSGIGSNVSSETCTNHTTSTPGSDVSGVQSSVWGGKTERQP